MASKKEAVEEQKFYKYIMENFTADEMIIEKVTMTDWPDRLVVLAGGKIAFFEFKRVGEGRLSTGQSSVIDRLKLLGIPVYVVYTAEEAVKHLRYLR